MFARIAHWICWLAFVVFSWLYAFGVKALLTHWKWSRMEISERLIFGGTVAVFGLSSVLCLCLAFDLRNKRKSYAFTGIPEKGGIDWFFVVTIIAANAIIYT